MNRLILRASVVVALLIVSSSAFAAGINLAWSACAGEVNAVQNKNFACTSNVGSNLLVCSFVLGADLVQVSGNEIVIDIYSGATALPAWWDLKNVGSCRQTALGFNVTADANNAVCLDWAQGQSSGGIGAYTTELGSIDPSLSGSHRRVKIALAVPQTGLQDLLAATDYFACNVSVNNTKTVGTGLCAGCSVPICLILNSIKLTTPTPSNDVTVGNAASPNSNIATWQGTSLNCLPTPTRNTTWGAVKSLYR